VEDLDPEPDPDPNLIILDPDPCDQIMKDPSGFGTLIMSITVSDPRWSHADPTPDFSLFINKICKDLKKVFQLPKFY